MNTPLDRLTTVCKECADLMATLETAEATANVCRSALQRVLTERLTLEKGIAVGRVVQYNPLGQRRAANYVPERAYIESITWEIPGSVMRGMGHLPAPRYKLRRINADNRKGKITHDENNLLKWDMTGETLDLSQTEWA